MAPKQTALSTTTMSSLTTKASATSLKQHLGHYVDLEVGSKYRQIIRAPPAPSSYGRRCLRLRQCLHGSC
eukprot:scaffold270425_cov64-Attheya_sp.AAC.1